MPREAPVTMAASSGMRRDSRRPGGFATSAAVPSPTSASPYVIGEDDRVLAVAAMWPLTHPRVANMI